MNKIKTDATKIKAACINCDWKGELSKCLNKKPKTELIKGGVLQETEPICPECFGRINW